MAEQFKVSQVKDEVSIYDETVEIPVYSQDKEYTIKLKPFFSPTSVRDCVEQIANFYKLAKEEGLTIPTEEADDLNFYFILKNYTDMIFTKSKKAKGIYSEFKMVLNSQVFKTLAQAIPKESIQSVYERIYEVIEANAELENQLKQYQEMIKNLPLENRDIIFPDKPRKQIPEV